MTPESPHCTVTFNITELSCQVSDAQGKSDTKSTKITVLPDPDYLNVVEVVLNKNISHFFQKQVSSWPSVP